MYMQGILGTQKGKEIISTIENSKDPNGDIVKCQ